MKYKKQNNFVQSIFTAAIFLGRESECDKIKRLRNTGRIRIPYEEIQIF